MFLVKAYVADWITNCSRKGSINRYYDPATDQFISVDPMVQMTDQPYMFTNDNPLNSEDPIGLRPVGSSASMSSSSASYKPTVLKQTTGALGLTLTTTYTANTMVLQGLGGTSIKITTDVSIVGPGSVSKVNVTSDGNVSVAVAGSGTASFSSSANISLSGSSVAYSYSGSQSVGHGSNADTVNVSVTVSLQPGSGGSLFDSLGLATVVGGVSWLTGRAIQFCAANLEICGLPAT
jgi:hypothetical protein